MTQPRGALSGVTVAVTRAADQADALVDMLQAHGAHVVRVPLLRVVDDAEGLEALRRVLDRPEPPDGVIVTSPNGARCLAAAWGDATGPLPPVYVVGPGTQAALQQAGGPTAAGVAADHVAEGVLAMMGPGSGTLVVAQGDLARPALVDGLRRAGWHVDAIEVYRTVPCEPSPQQVQAARQAHVVTLASGSAARVWARITGAASEPAVVVMGPITAQTAEALGLHVVEVATPHSLEGLVQATIRAVSRRRPTAGQSAS